MTLRDFSPGSAGGVDAHSRHPASAVWVQSLPSLFVRAISRTA
jgi:hypothetical protein